jgi:hypothetical protein
MITFEVMNAFLNQLGFLGVIIGPTSRGDVYESTEETFIRMLLDGDLVFRDPAAICYFRLQFRKEGLPVGWPTFSRMIVGSPWDDHAAHHAAQDFQQASRAAQVVRGSRDVLRLFCEELAKEPEDQIAKRFGAARAAVANPDSRLGPGPTWLKGFLEESCHE